MLVLPYDTEILINFPYCRVHSDMAHCPACVCVYSAGAAVGFTPRCIAYSPAPIASTNTHHLAVGGAKGHLKVRVHGECSTDAAPAADRCWGGGLGR